MGGEYLDVRDTWVQFDLQLYRFVEPVTRGDGRSIALFLGALPHGLDELEDVEVLPSFSAQVAESEETVPSLDPGLESRIYDGRLFTQAHQPTEALWPLSAQVHNLTLPNHSEQLLIDQWCRSEHVALPFTDLPPSNVSMMSINEEAWCELSERILSGHRPRSNLRRGCLEAEGPRRIHRSIREVDKATHFLHIDF